MSVNPREQEIRDGVLCVFIITKIIMIEALFVMLKITAD